MNARVSPSSLGQRRVRGVVGAAAGRGLAVGVAVAAAHALVARIVDGVAGGDGAARVRVARHAGRGQGRALAVGGAGVSVRAVVGGPSDRGGTIAGRVCAGVAGRHAGRGARVARRQRGQAVAGGALVAGRTRCHPRKKSEQSLR